MDRKEQKMYINLLKKEVVPALGCTEPIAVALAAAKAKEILKKNPENIDIFVSGNILKNGMGVGIPGTSSVGLNIAAALGAIGGNSKENLEVLKGINDKHISEAKKLVNEGNVGVHLKDIPDKLYIEVICRSGYDKSKVIIKDRHTNIVLIELNENVIYEDTNKNIQSASIECKDFNLNVENIYKFTNNVEIEDVKYLLDAVRMNMEIAKEGIKGKHGLQVGRKIFEKVKSGFLGDDILTYAMSYTSAAADARMSGCMYPVMSNSGSGNQGITVMVPVAAVAEKLELSNEKLIRALVLSNLIAIHIKKNLGQLSALCGCVVAAIGSSCGITYLLGGELDNIVYAIKNMIGNVSGMLCDGAKNGCALKVCTTVCAAIQSAILAIDGIEISDNDGIIENDVEKCIKNLAIIGSKGLDKADKLMLEIMTSK